MIDYQLESVHMAKLVLMAQVGSCACSFPVSTCRHPAL